MTRVCYGSLSVDRCRFACVAAASTGDDPISTHRARTVASDSSSRRAVISSNTSWGPWTAGTCPNAEDQFTGVDWPGPRGRKSARRTWPEAYQGVFAAGTLTADHSLEPGVRATRARVTESCSTDGRHQSDDDHKGLKDLHRYSTTYNSHLEMTALVSEPAGTSGLSRGMRKPRNR